MPRLKKITITFNNEMGHISTDIEIFVNSNGLFYANLEDNHAPAIEDVFNSKLVETLHGKGKIKVLSENLDDLTDKLESVIKLTASPDKREELVILYNIETDISFVESKEGDIYPNGTYVKNFNNSASWNDQDKYGGHDAAHPSKGGYKLTIGAMAKRKTIYTYGKTEVIEYSSYYGEGGSHHGHSLPAEKLNSWCSFTLPKGAMEIPYSDEAALFFYNLLYGMANISKMIQDSTFDQNNLLRLIASGNNMLPSPKQKDH